MPELYDSEEEVTAVPKARKVGKSGHNNNDNREPPIENTIVTTKNRWTSLTSASSRMRNQSAKDILDVKVRGRWRPDCGRTPRGANPKHLGTNGQRQCCVECWAPDRTQQGAVQDRAGQCPAGCSSPAIEDRTRQGAGMDRTRQGAPVHTPKLQSQEAGPDRTRQGATIQDRARLDRTRQGAPVHTPKVQNMKAETGGRLGTLGVVEPEGICTIEAEGEWELVKLAVDSGATETVVGEDSLRSVKLKEGAATRRGTMYQVADGTLIPNLGEKTFTATTEDGQTRQLTAQVCGASSRTRTLEKRCGWQMKKACTSFRCG
jgi:hypothetical protein